ncbi:MAG: TolC family protein [Desulfopila sp.]
MTMLVSAAAFARPPTNWSLAQAVDYAIDNNPEIQLTLERMAAARAMTEVASSATLPTISLQSEYSQTDNPMHSFGNLLNQGAFDNSIDFNDPGRTDDLALQTMLAYRLYDGGRRTAGVAQARAEKQAAEHRLAAAHQQLAYEVVRSYYAILKAEEMVKVHNGALAAIEASLAVGKARYAEGDLLKADLLNLELQQARAVENSLNGQHRRDLAEKVFWNLLGSVANQPSSLPHLVEKQAPPTRLDHSARTELAVADDSIAAARAGLVIAQGAKRPVVDTYASYRYDYGTVLGESGDSWQAGVRLNYDLYDGHRTEAGIAAARARLAEMRAAKAKLELDLDLELQQAKIRYSQSVERLQVTARMVRVAQESARLSRQRFREGTLLAAELIDREMRLTDALARQATAGTDNRIAIANLRRATGSGQFERMEKERLRQETPR